MKNCLYLLVFLASLQIAHSQKTMGVKAGVNIARIESSEDDDNEVESIPGIVFGAYVINELSDNFHFRPEFLFSSNGYKLTGELNGDEIEFTERMYYLEVPIYLSFVSGSDDIKFNLDFGPFLGVGVGGNWEASLIGANNSQSEVGDVAYTMEINENNIDNFEDDDTIWNLLNGGLTFGAGLSFNKITASFAYNYGLVNMIPEIDLPGVNIELDEVFSRSARITLSYTLN